MRKLIIGVTVLGFLTACAASVQEQRATLESAARSLGATDVKSIEYTGNGVWYQVGQNKTAGQRWPRFNLPSYTRAANYETASLRDTAPVDVIAPEPVRATVSPYAPTKSDKVADGVWYVTGGTHHSVVIEMADHVVVVEAPLNDQRALAVLGETRRLVPTKPIRYVIVTHHHYDHSGGLRAFAAEGVTVIAHESSRAFYERAFAAAATVDPDQLSRGARRGAVEGMGDRRTLTDGRRVVDIHLLKDNGHADGFLMVHLPAEKLLVEADAFSPLAPNAPVPTPPSPFTVNLADNITRLNLAVERILPIHGRMVPLAELHRTIGR